MKNIITIMIILICISNSFGCAKEKDDMDKYIAVTEDNYEELSVPSPLNLQEYAQRAIKEKYPDAEYIAKVSGYDYYYNGVNCKIEGEFSENSYKDSRKFTIIISFDDPEDGSFNLESFEAGIW